MRIMNNMKIIEFQMRIMEIMKILEFHLRINNVLESIEFLARIIKNENPRILHLKQYNHEISWKNNANHETPRIQLENYENYRNLR